MGGISDWFNNPFGRKVERGIKSAKKAIERRVKDQRKELTAAIADELDTQLAGLAPVAQDALLQTLLPDFLGIIQKRAKEAAKGVM